METVVVVAEGMVDVKKNVIVSKMYVGISARLLFLQRTAYKRYMTREYTHKSEVIDIRNRYGTTLATNDSMARYVSVRSLS